MSINGLLAALRTHLPKPGRASDGKGAGGGTLACTQALHVFRSLFEDLTLLDARENFGYGASRADDAAARNPAGQWRQLRPRQLRELVMQLAVVVDTLGVSPPQWK